MSELEKKLVEYMDKTAGAIEQVLDFSMEQAPLVVKEIISYGFWSGVLWIVISAGMILFSIKKYKELRTLKKVASYPEDKKLGFAQFCVFVLSVVFVIVFACNIQKLVKVSVAPRLYIIDSLRGAVTK